MSTSSTPPPTAPRRASSMPPPLVEPVSLDELMVRYPTKLPSVRLDATGEPLCLCCPTPIALTTNRIRFCEPCGRERRRMKRQQRKGQLRPPTMPIETATLDLMMERNTELQRAIGVAVSRFEQSRADNREPSQWIRDLSSAAKGVEAIIYNEVTRAVLAADAEAERRLKQEERARALRLAATRNER